MLLSVVIPMFNEELTAENTAKTVSDRLRRENITFEIIFSDDGSSDSSADVIRSLLRAIPELRLISAEKHRGKGHALKNGALAAKGEYVIFTDCDLAYGCEPIIKLLDELRGDGCDVCIGSRALHPNGYLGYPIRRKISSKIFIEFLKRYAQISVTDAQCGIKGFSGAAAKKLFAYAITHGYALDTELLMRAEKCGMTVREMPVQLIRHKSSCSKVKPLEDGLKMIGDIKKIKKQLQ